MTKFSLQYEIYLIKIEKGSLTHQLWKIPSQYKFKSNLYIVQNIFKPSQPYFVRFTFPATSPTAYTAGMFVAWNSSVIIFPASSSSIPAYTDIYIYRYTYTYIHIYICTYTLYTRYSFHRTLPL